MKLLNLMKLKQGLALLAVTSVTCLPGSSNLAPPMDNEYITLHEEAVNVKISGKKAEVSGTFYFEVVSSYVDASKYELFIPVYAVEGTNPDEIKPTLIYDGKPLPVTHTAKHSYGEVNTVAGQIPFWFTTTVSAEDFEKDTTKKLKIEMSYKQALAGGAFIYTPLIPQQKESKDYGSITFTADKPLTLKTEKAHDFVSRETRLIVEPHHKRSIIVKVGSVVP